MASKEAHPDGAMMMASRDDVTDDGSKGAGDGERTGTEASSAGDGAGEMMFPKGGSTEQVREWFVNCGGGEFKSMREHFVGLSAISVFGLSMDSFQKDLGAIRGEALYNAIHKHDRAAATGTAATDPDALSSATAFVTSLIGSKLEAVPGAKDGMRVLKGIKDVRGGPEVTVVVRAVTEPFWRECIRLTGEGHRVCAVGSPGIGKSTTTALLIKMLLEEGRTVVYLKRTPTKRGWYFHFIPGEPLGVQMYSEQLAAEDICALLDKDTFFVVDPDKTEDTCDPSSLVKARVIINASPDSKHWGGSEFIKSRDGFIGGTFRYYPLWSLIELVAAQPYILATASAEEVFARYREFGGVPRAAFAPTAQVLSDLRKSQDDGLSGLTDMQVRHIANDDVSSLDTRSEAQPKSSVMGYMASAPFSAEEARTVIVSEVVRERVWSQHIGQLWRLLLLEDKSSTRGHAFEAYVRRLMLRDGGNEFPSRKAVGKTGDRTESRLQLLQCTSIRLVEDVAAAVKACATGGVVYHSVNQRYPLVDFMFKVGDVFYGVNPTIGATHMAPAHLIEKLITALGMKVGSPKLRLLYAVPMDRFKDFLTDPVTPSTTQCDVLVIGVANPGEEGGAGGGGKRPASGASTSATGPGKRSKI